MRSSGTLLLSVLLIACFVFADGAVAADSCPPSGPFITYVPFDGRSVPAAVDPVCVAGTPPTYCAVINWNGFQYYTLPFKDNNTRAMALLAFDANARLVARGAIGGVGIDRVSTLDCFGMALHIEGDSGTIGRVSWSELKSMTAPDLDASSIVGVARAVLRVRAKNAFWITSVTLNGVPVPFKIEDPFFVFTVPDDADNGPLVVGNASGSSTAAFYLPPVIESISKTQSTCCPWLIVTGKHFGGATSGGTIRDSGTIDSFSLHAPTAYGEQILTKTTLKMVPSGSGHVSITTPGGTAISTERFIAVPTPDSLKSTTAINRGDTIKIDGHYFSEVKDVQFPPGISAKFTMLSNGSLTATVPQTALSGAVTLVTNDVSANTPVVALKPTIVSVSPKSGPAGTVVTITGFVDEVNRVIQAQSVFQCTEDVIYHNLSLCDTGGCCVTVTPSGTGTLTFTVPATAKTGRIGVKTVAPGSPQDQLALTDVFVVPPTLTCPIDGFNTSRYDSGSSGRKVNSITLTGSNLIGGQSAGTLGGVTIDFSVAGGGVKAGSIGEVKSFDKIRVAPPDDAVDGVVTLRTADGTATCAIKITNGGS